MIFKFCPPKPFTDQREWSQSKDKQLVSTSVPEGGGDCSRTMNPPETPTLLGQRQEACRAPYSISPGTRDLFLGNRVPCDRHSTDFSGYWLTSVTSIQPACNVSREIASIRWRQDEWLFFKIYNGGGGQDTCLSGKGVIHKFLKSGKCFGQYHSQLTRPRQNQTCSKSSLLHL